MKQIKGKNIVLTGFMGVGKTTIGKDLANQLNRGFVDMDEEIEKAVDMSIPDIFQTYGEAYFRDKERELIASYSRLGKRKVISLGGGAFLQEETRRLCLSECLVVFLDLSWPFWKERISLLRDSRPLLQGRTEEEIKALFDERQEIYAAHHLKIKIDNLSPHEASEEIIDALQHHPDFS
ncbi:shikimate kinase [Lentibacillus sediminis]|uniref:shikimate kinase n=1 Tax=Lentibacillus sediminis TaxID=1940529 RepID=UPI000C1C194C|nr:shikimate kinase [Lentibacillus sediminis]